MAMMLAAARGLVAAENWARSGAWAEHGMFPLQTRVSNKRVGILGLGRIGYEIAKRCAAFDMDIAYTDLVPRDLASSWTLSTTPESWLSVPTFFCCSARRSGNPAPG